jgi:hypothetical protein
MNHQENNFKTSNGCLKKWFQAGNVTIIISSQLSASDAFMVIFINVSGWLSCRPCLEVKFRGGAREDSVHPPTVRAPSRKNKAPPRNSKAHPRQEVTILLLYQGYLTSVNCKTRVHRHYRQPVERCQILVKNGSNASHILVKRWSRGVQTLVKC